MPGTCQKTRIIKYDNRMQRPGGFRPAIFDLAHLTAWRRIYAGVCLLESFRTRISPGDSDIRQAREMRSASSGEDRKSTRLNSSHVASSHAVSCLKTKQACVR